MRVDNGEVIALAMTPDVVDVSPPKLAHPTGTNVSPQVVAGRSAASPPQASRHVLREPISTDTNIVTARTGSTATLVCLQTQVPRHVANHGKCMVRGKCHDVDSRHSHLDSRE